MKKLFFALLLFCPILVSAKVPVPESIRVEYDKVENITKYGHSLTPLTLRITQNNKGVSLLLILRYEAYEWLFIDKIKLLAGSNRMEITGADFDLAMQNNDVLDNGSILERFSVVVDSTEISMTENQKKMMAGLEKCFENFTAADEFIIRWYGEKGYLDSPAPLNEEKQLKSSSVFWWTRRANMQSVALQARTILEFYKALKEEELKKSTAK